MQDSSVKVWIVLVFLSVVGLLNAAGVLKLLLRVEADEELLVSHNQAIVSQAELTGLLDNRLRELAADVDGMKNNPVRKEIEDLIKELQRILRKKN